MSNPLTKPALRCLRCQVTADPRDPLLNHIEGRPFTCPDCIANSIERAHRDECTNAVISAPNVKGLVIEDGLVSNCDGPVIVAGGDDISVTGVQAFNDRPSNHTAIKVRSIGNAEALRNSCHGYAVGLDIEAQTGTVCDNFTSRQPRKSGADS